MDKVRHLITRRCRGLLLITFALASLGCTRTDTNRQEQRQVRETATVAGTVAGVPVDVHAESTRVETAAETERSETTVPALDALAQAAPAMIGPAAGAGVLGPVAGVLGLGAAALTWWRGRQALSASDNALGRVVAGIEAAKATLPAPAVDTLHGALARRLDAADKSRIRRIKAAT
jgi:hypothetical protein